jgi:hypothetical protein
MDDVTEFIASLRESLSELPLDETLTAAKLIVLLDGAERGLEGKRNAYSIEWLSRPEYYRFNEEGGVR